MAQGNPVDKDREINKPDFIRLVAQDAGFSITDIKTIWESVERIFARSILSNKILNIGGFGKLYVQEVKGTDKAFHPKKHVRYTRKPSKRIVFHASSTFKNLIKESDNNGEEEE